MSDGGCRPVSRGESAAGQKAFHFLYLSFINKFMKQKLVLVFLLFIVFGVGFCQVPLRQFKITSSYTSFPDTGRMKGHLYNDSLYNATDHYSDSSVIIIIPENFNVKKKADLIFWFHGWNNNIDSALIRYGLSRQIAESGVNAVLVLAETAKDAPDSYGGKLEQVHTFNKLVKDVLQKLVSVHVISGRCRAGNVILAGHSGAYRVIANILQNGEVPVNEVILFDALYADTGKFLNWIKEDRDHRFINLYTNNGGTYGETKDMMLQVKTLNIPEDSVEESEVTPRMLQDNGIIFIHTLHEHNDIIQHPDNFRLFLDNTPFLEKRRFR
jgi:hypothetical protein